MKHLSDEDLVLHYYGEGEAVGRPAVEAHLEACEACRRELALLRRTFAAADVSPVPARGEGYEREVWARLEPRLAAARPRWWDVLTPRRLALAGGVAVLVVAAFAAGRFWPSPQPAPAAQDAANPQVRERILLVAVGDHLDRSQMVLAELLNADPDGGVDISGEQARARDLVETNRLYRQTAATAGEPGVASVLDDLERVLLEIAHSPSSLSSADFERFRDRIETQGIVFKIRVLGTRVREREAAGTDAAAS